MKKLLLVLTILAAISCSKYEEGPNLSLRTKKSRLKGDWLLKTINDIAPGSAKRNADFVDVIWSFERKNKEYKGDYSLECYQGCNVAYFTYANWSLVRNTAILRLTPYNDSMNQGADSPIEFTIVKLANKELILKRKINTYNDNTYVFEKVKK